MSTSTSPEAAAVVYARKDMIAALTNYNKAWVEMYYKRTEECEMLRAENTALRTHLASVQFLVSQLTLPPVPVPMPMQRCCGDDVDDDKCSSN
jgi:hypothetical protein